MPLGAELLEVVDRSTNTSK